MRKQRTGNQRSNHETINKIKEVNKAAMDKWLQTHHPWDKLPNETLSAYSSFVQFRSLPLTKRNIPNAAALTGKGLNTLYQYSRAYQWFDRADSYDLYNQQLVQDAYLKAQEEMFIRHAKHSMAIETAIMLPVTEVLKKLKANPELLANKNIDELMDMVYNSAQQFSKIVDVERKSRGVSTENKKLDITSNGNSLEPTINIVVNGSQSPLLNQLNLVKSEDE